MVLSPDQGSSRCTRLLAWLSFSLLAGASVAQASGPTERLQQILPHPTDPNLITVRFGMASSGYLYSKDGGKTFRATCSSAVSPAATGDERVDKITFRSIASTTANAIDSDGRVLFSQYHYLYEDDGTGCTWKRDDDFQNRWAFGVHTDPVTPGVVWAAVGDSSGEKQEASLSIARRDESGAWAIVGPIAPTLPNAGLLDGNMVASDHKGKVRLYVTADIGTVDLTTGQAVYTQHVYVSDDEGKTWSDTALPLAQESLALLAVDPQNADRLVGVIWRDGEADQLFLSEDAGKTFKPYPGTPGIRAVSGSTFDKKGRFLIGDQGDGADDGTSGGLFVADKLGAPLKRAAGTSYVDCIHYRALTDTLYMCNYDTLNKVDPDTFAPTQLVKLETVAGLLECEGKDLVAECREQLNSGPSWCCTGHFPFTPFCGAYDITSVNIGGTVRNVFCGLAGREYERPGSTTADAGAPLASIDVSPESSGEPTASVRPKAASAGGCALGEASGAGFATALISGLTFGLAALVRTGRRRGARR